MANGKPGRTTNPKPKWAVRQVDGKERWDVPSLRPGADPSDRPWVEIEDVEPTSRWEGIWFRVTFDTAGIVAAFSVERHESVAALTARTVQAIPFAAIERVARARIHDWVHAWWANKANGPPDWLQELDDVGRQPERDLWLARIAKRYVETIGKPQQRALLAKEFDVSWDYVPELISEARDRRLLTPTVRGRAGGDLTQRAWLMLIRGIPESTPEEIEAVHKRDEPFLELTEWGDRLDQLMKETFGDPGDSIQVNRGKD